MTGTPPRAAAPAPADLAQLRQTAATLAEAIAGQPDAALRFRPAPGEWCAAELIGHLFDNERVYRHERFAAILATDGATFAGYDQGRMVRDGGYATADTLALLDALTPPQWTRTGTRPDRGTFTLAGVVGLLAAHDRLHLAQIAATLRVAVGGGR